MYKRDRHTDRQTPHDAIGRTCIALCSKNSHTLYHCGYCPSSWHCKQLKLVSRRLMLVIAVQSITLKLATHYVAKNARELLRACCAPKKCCNLMHRFTLPSRNWRRRLGFKLECSNILSSRKWRLGFKLERSNILPSRNWRLGFKLERSNILPSRNWRLGFKWERSNILPSRNWRLGFKWERSNILPSRNWRLGFKLERSNILPSRNWRLGFKLECSNILSAKIWELAVICTLNPNGPLLLNPNWLTRRVIYR